MKDLRLIIFYSSHTIEKIKAIEKPSDWHK